jgi:dTDP-4-dehydrorhamnose 3,5-epimerase
MAVKTGARGTKNLAPLLIHISRFNISHMSDDYPAPREIIRQAIPLPAGVGFHPLTTHQDSRGNFTELNRASWKLAIPVQWNMVHSRPNVLRGVHVHRLHEDLLTVTAGEMILGLRDLRAAAPTHGLTAMVRLAFDDPHVVTIPSGVAHGFYFTMPSCHIYSVTHEFDASDELGCHWRDPLLSLRWPGNDPQLSERDRNAGSFPAMVAALNG